MDAPLGLGDEDVLSQPTRARLFTLLETLRRPAQTTELATTLGLHANGVRTHLERMERAGLVRRARVRTSRGRPPDAWMIAPDARPGGHAPYAYRDLGRWLVRALGAGLADVSSVQDTGRQIGRELAPPVADIDTFLTSLSALGFAPGISHQDDDGLSLCLHNCPYADAVHENQPLVCALHRGMTQGLLDANPSGPVLADFIPHDPDEAGCVVELRGAFPG